MRQIPCAQAHIGWIVGRLDVGASELAQRLQIEFEKVEDDLGPAEAVAFEDADGFQFGVFELQQKPDCVFIVLNEFVDNPVQALGRALVLLGLTHSNVAEYSSIFPDGRPWMAERTD